MVDEARPIKSKLHPCFEWDDKRAAQKYRLHRARQLIGSIIEVKYTDKEKHPVKVFVNVKTEKNEQINQRYLTIDDALKNEESTSYIISVARNEMQHWIDTYNSYKALSDYVKSAKQIVIDMTNA